MQETKYTKKLYKAIRKLNLDQEELKGLLLCLYINGCPSEDCAKLFGNTQEKIVSFLESEELYGYKACTKCSQLSDRINGFYQLKNRGHSICKECRIKHMIGDIFIVQKSVNKSVQHMVKKSTLKVLSLHLQEKSIQC